MKETRFKDTEIGRIPEEWKVKKIKSIAEVHGRIGFRGYTVNDLVSVGFGALVIGGKHISKNKLDLSNPDYISWSKYYESPEIMVHIGDVVMAQRGTLGRIALIDRSIGPATINPSLVLLNHIKCNPNFLFQLISGTDCTERILSMSSQTSIPMISQNQIENFSIALPCVSEQSRIASALTSIDNLISSLDKLIEKKKNIKQGAMQQLLTGKKRLNGFTDPWVNAILKDHVSIGYGRDYKGLKEGPIPVFGTGGYMTSVSECLYDGPTVCIGRKGTINRPQYHEGPIWTVDTLFFLHSFVGVTPKFLYYLFHTIDWMAMNEATGVPSLTANSIEQLGVVLPSMEEQLAIASVLTIMDNDISTLESQKTKNESIKQGMMQQLLTGEIRLVAFK